MKTAAVILNYNDADQTIEAVRRIAGFEQLDTIIVVDNASTDDSAKRLKVWLREENRRYLEAEDAEDDDTDDETEQFHRYMLVHAEKNGGYGAGNDLGIQYAYEIAGAELVLIANPDAVFTEDCLQAMIGCFETDANAAVVSAPEKSAEGKLLWQRSAWPLRSFLGELLHSGPLSRRLFHKLLQYPEAYFEGKGAVQVDVVHGAFLMVDADRFMACGGYDENIFLYGEENVLAYKLREHGCRTLLLTEVSYSHAGGGTIKKRFRSAVDRQKLRQSAELYYYKTYLGISWPAQLFAKAFQKIVLLETRLFLH